MPVRPTTSLFGLAALLRGLAVFCFGVMVTGPVVSAEVVYVAESAQLVSAPSESATVVATLAVAAQLRVLETRDGFHRVTLSGWAREGAERALFAYPGKRIVVGLVPAANVPNLEPVGSHLDPDTAITWNHLRLGGWITEVSTVAEVEPIWDAAWALFAERCTACHERRVPQKYTANQWRSLVKVMGPRTGLPKADQQLILTFLQHHASDTVSKQTEGGASELPDAGR